MESFNQRKKSTLSKIDKSSRARQSLALHQQKNVDTKEYWDKKIVSLCEKINSSENCYTTSSCSGRIVLIADSAKKSPGLFVKVWHELISFEELKKEIARALHSRLMKGAIMFKQEPVILHVACDSLESALSFLEKARSVGFKRGGIISGGKRFVLELIGTEKLEFPIIENGKILVDDMFLKLVVKKSNENLKKSWERIGKLKNIL